jgi:prepilin-type N-terminal cleavage/methylation domain-containing protein
MTTMRGRICLLRGTVGRRSFTLTELLAVIAIIVVIASVTVLSVRGVAREARLSSAVNTVTSALDHGRAMAIRDETYVAVAFRARPVGSNKQQIEIVTARWTGESPLLQSAGSTHVIDRYVPIPGVASRRLPPGISIASPIYEAQPYMGAVGDFSDRIWGWASFLPTVAAAQGPSIGPGDPPGRIFAVIYSPDGTVVLRNSKSRSIRMFIDFNNDGIQQVAGCTACNGEVNYIQFPTVPGWPVFNIYMSFQFTADDEPFITSVPFLAIYDEDQFRDEYDTREWDNDNWPQKHRDLTEFVTENAERIHFNRYTGVVLR